MSKKLFYEILVLLNQNEIVYKSRKRPPTLTSRKFKLVFGQSCLQFHLPPQSSFSLFVYFLIQIFVSRKVLQGRRIQFKSITTMLPIERYV